MTDAPLEPVYRLNLTLEDATDLFEAYKNFNKWRSIWLTDSDEEACNRLELRLQAAMERLQNKTPPTAPLAGSDAAMSKPRRVGPTETQ